MVKYGVIIFLCVVIIILSSFDYNVDETPIFLKIYRTSTEGTITCNQKDISKVINDIILDDGKVSRLVILRHNTSLTDMDGNFILNLKRETAGRTIKEIQVKNNTKNESYKFLDFRRIETEKIWNLKDNFKSYQPSLLKFSGVIETSSTKTGYIYFNDKLVEVNESTYIGDRKVLKIFNDGILLEDPLKNFEVIK